MKPGRSMVAPHGVLVANVVQEKRTPNGKWAFIDAAMNDLIRPALYGARHRIEPLDRLPSAPLWRVAGPVCESADDFGEHPLGDTLPRRVVIRDAGAYGFTMASEYNGRPLPAEIFVSEGAVKSVSASPGRDAWVARRLGRRVRRLPSIRLLSTFASISSGKRRPSPGLRPGDRATAAARFALDGAGSEHRSSSASCVQIAAPSKPAHFRLATASARNDPHRSRAARGTRRRPESGGSAAGRR